MSSSAATGPLSQSAISAEEVADYLNRNPTFFHVFPNLLDKLSIPHPKTGQAVSLLERQVHLLRQQRDALQGDVDNMMDIAGANGQLFTKVQQFAKALVASENEQQAVDCIYGQLQTTFQVDQVALLSWDVPSAGLSGLSQLGVSQTWSNAMKNALEWGKPVCGFVENDWQKGLFRCDDLMQSVCLLPLGDEASQRVWGVLALGSVTDRFHPDLGTTFLKMMAELISARLNRLFTAG